MARQSTTKKAAPRPPRSEVEEVVVVVPDDTGEIESTPADPQEGLPDPTPDLVATLGPDAPPIPVGTPVRAAGGEVGKVISYDPTTRQAQISFNHGGRGWHNIQRLSVLTDADSR